MLPTEWPSPGPESKRRNAPSTTSQPPLRAFQLPERSVSQMSDQTITPPVRTAPGVFRSPISTTARAVELLEALGATADQVAATLTTGGHLGLLSECDACPVADYLMRSDLHAAGVRIYDDGVQLDFRDEDGAIVDRVDMPTPKAVTEFIQRFDRGQFPQLVKGGAAA